MLHHFSAEFSPIVLSLLAVTTLAAQDKPVVVLQFDQMAVMESAREVFGGEYDLGRGIAKLVSERLADQGVTVIEDQSTAAGSVEGTILVFGKAEASGEAGGVSLGRLRVGIGRREEKAAVSLEARLIDAASGMTVTDVMGSGESDRGGWNAFARLRGGPDLAHLDLSSDEFKRTAIGDATHKAVDQLCDEIKDAVDRLGTFAREEPTPPAMPTGEEPSAGAAMQATPGGPVGTFAWAPYQFRGSEHFRYDVRQQNGSDLETGFYQLDFQPAGANRVRMQVNWKLGDQSQSSTVTTGTGPDGMQIGYGQMMALGPAGVLLFNPMSWMMFQGHELTKGDGWSYSNGGESVSIRVEDDCQAAGHAGLSVVVRQNDAVAQESCIAPDVALPLRMMIRSDDTDTMEMTLVEYRP